MDTLIYWFGCALVALIQALPLTFVARLGRAGGGLAYWLDARHRRVALKNLTMCFGNEKSPDEIRALARENFRRIGENYACAIKTSMMTFTELRPHVEFVGMERMLPLRRIINAGGHFGNFELYTRVKDLAPGYPCAATYRALNQPALNRLMEKLRNHSGCLFFERRTDGAALRAALNQPAIMLSLQIDQHGGDKGLRLPFLGHDCSTNSSPAFLRSATIANFTPPSVFASGWRSGGLKPANRFPRTKTAGHAASKTSCATCSAPTKPPSAVTRPTGFGCTNGGNPLRPKSKVQSSRVENPECRRMNSQLRNSQFARRRANFGSRNQLAWRRGHDHARAAAPA